MSLPDLDQILTAIRAEAARRGASMRIGIEATEMTGIEATASMRLVRPALVGEPRHVRDFLALSTEALLEAAYRRLLKRAPDVTGLENFRRLLRTGKRTKVEVLGLIRFSSEGRKHAVAVRGVCAAFALAMVYRIPVVGFIAAFGAIVLRLPPYLRDRSSLEYSAQEVASEFEG